MKLFESKKTDNKTDLEKVEERREEVLSKGRKFKYPLQYTKHRIVVNTILISIVVAVFLAVGGWLALYRFQMTDEILYRMTTIVPVSVANVDGEQVRFSDYLMLYRSSIASIGQRSGNLDDSENGEWTRTMYKRAALTSAEEYAYAMKLGREAGVTVSDEEVDNEFERHRQVGGIDRSEEGFLKVLKDDFGMSRSEYERMLYLNIMKAKVSAVIDTDASALADRIEVALSETNNDFKAVAGKFEGRVLYEETGGLVANKNIDGGRASEALKLEPGQTSGRFMSINGDSFYFVKLVNKTDAEVNFVSIAVPFREFDRRFEEIKNTEGGVNEYITLE